MGELNLQQQELAGLIRSSRKILIFTGAGISTGSGIPDFRGPQGVWTRRKPVYYEDFMASEKARAEHWDYKLESWPAFRGAKPNAAHAAVVNLEHAGKLLLLVTQNIDGLHEKAGSSRGRLVELHGTNSRIECQSCHELSDPEPHFVEFSRTHRPPVCACGGFLKPATISFGQMLNSDDISRSEWATMRADLVISLGSSLSVYPAAGIPLMAAERGAPYVIINRGPTEHDELKQLRLRIEGDVAAVFPPVIEAALFQAG